MPLEFVQQVLVVLAFFAGLVLGEALVSRAFGRPKRAVLAFVEIVVFAVLLTIVGMSVWLTTSDFNTMLGINFVIGFVVAVVARGVSTGLGAFAEAAQKQALGGYSHEEKLVIAAAETLAEHGVEEEEIRKALASAGFSRKAVDSVFAAHRFETKPHPLLREVARLEQEITALRKRAKKA